MVCTSIKRIAACHRFNMLYVAVRMRYSKRWYMSKEENCDVFSLFGIELLLNY